MKNKKLFSVILMVMLLFTLSACGSSTKNEGTADLTGTWKEVDAGDSYQKAVITEDTIEVFWMTDDTESLYWAGTYEAPEKAVTEYTWDSENDHSKTDTAMLASPADTKTFTYSDGKLSYEVSALGTTKTVKLEKTE